MIFLVKLILQVSKASDKQFNFRSAHRGSGAGGSVVIYAKELVGNPKDEILVSIGEPVVYALGAGEGGYI